MCFIRAVAVCLTVTYAHADAGRMHNLPLGMVYGQDRTETGRPTCTWLLLQWSLLKDLWKNQFFQGKPPSSAHGHRGRMQPPEILAPLPGSWTPLQPASLREVGTAGAQRHLENHFTLNDSYISLKKSPCHILVSEKYSLDSLKLHSW